MPNNFAIEPAAAGGGLTNINISAGTTSNNLSALTFSNLNGVTFGLNGSTLTASVAAGGGDAIRGIAAGGSTASTNTVNFSNSNGISFGFGAAGNSTVITGSHNALTSQSNPAFSADASSTFQTLSFQNSNGLTFSNNAGAIRVSYTVPVQSNGILDVSTATASGTATSRFAMHDHQHRGIRGIAAVGTASTFFGDFNLSGGNGVTLITGGASTAGSVGFSVANQTTQSAIKAFGASNTGNTAGNTGVSTGIDWVIAGSQAVTISESTVGGGPNTLWINAPNAGAGNVTFSAGTSSVGLASLVFSDFNSVSFGLDGSTITAIAPRISAGVSNLGNTAGSTGTVSVGNFVLVGSNAITLSQSTAAAGSVATITIRNEAEISRWALHWNIQGANDLQANSLVSVQPFILPKRLAFSSAEFAGSFNVASAANNSSAFQDVSMSGVLYTRTVSTLNSIASWSSTYTATWSSNATGSVTGIILMPATLAATTLSAGDYWLAVHVSTNNTATGGAATTALGNSLSMVLGFSASSAAGLARNFGGNTNATFGLIHGLGVISTGATLASINLGNVTATGSRFRAAPCYFDFRNNTWQ